MNSDLITYCYKKLSVPKANGYSIYKNAFLKELPVLINQQIDDEKMNIDNMQRCEFNDFIYKVFGIDDYEKKLIEEELCAYKSI